MTKHCGAITNSGSSCRLPAGFRTSHPGSGKCSHHEFPNDHSIPHRSKKLWGAVCNCRSKYEKVSLETLDSDPSVRAYTYEPRFKIPYDYYGKEHIYTPDVLVKYFGGKRVILEIKSIFEMGLPLEIAKNYAKFKAADLFATDMGMEFAIWVYDKFDKQPWSFKVFCAKVNINPETTR